MTTMNDTASADLFNSIRAERESFYQRAYDEGQIDEDAYLAGLEQATIFAHAEVERANRDTVQVRFGKALRAARKEVGLTQRQLAAQLGTHFTTVSYWENGKREIGLEMLYRLHEVTGGRIGYGKF